MSTDPVKMPPEGSSIGEFLLVKCVSKTLVGHFYEAKREDKTCLIHVLPEELVRLDRGFLKQYRIRIELLNKLKAEGILQVEEIVDAGKFSVVVYKGPAPQNCLIHRVEEQNAKASLLEEQNVRDVINQLGKTIKAAHDLKIGHFCITPSFVFIEGENTVKIAGIGLFESLRYQAFEQYISRAILPFSENKNKEITILDILSPEIRDHQDFDLRSDFYALGMTAYYLLIGCKPERRWLVPTKARLEVNEGWDLFISHCLEPRANDRFPSAKAFLNDLNSLENLALQPNREGGRILRVIERIPLPGRLLEQFTPKALLRIRLALITLVGLLAIGTAYLFLIIIFEDVDDDTNIRPVQRVASAELADITVRVRPEKAKISVTGSRRGNFLIKEGLIYLRTGKGKFTVSAQAPLYSTGKTSVEVSNEPIERVITLTIPWSDFEVQGVPESRISLVQGDEQTLFLGLIDREGALKLEDRIVAGSYRIRAEKQGYEPYLSEEVSLAEDTLTTLTTEQIALPGKLQVRSFPEGADVFIGEDLVGKTPIEIAELPQDPLSLTIRLEGYRKIERVLRIPPGETILLDADSLERKEGFLDLEINLGDHSPTQDEMNEIEVFMNETKLENWREIGEAPIDEGEIVVRVAHPDYKTEEKTFQIEDRLRETWSLKLQPKPAQIRLMIDSANPMRVLVDNVVVEPENGVIDLVPKKRQVVSIQLLNYFGVRQEFELGPNEREEWEVPLRPLPGPEMGEDWNPPYMELPMAWITPGSYQMSSPIREPMRLPNEDNRTRIIISKGFWVSTYEVTQKLYSRILNENPSQFKGENNPADSVSWSKAKEFCSTLNRRERDAGRLPKGYIYRLPTEAEWEFFARAGASTAFNFGDVATEENGNFKGNYGLDTNPKAEERPYGTVQVGSYPPNAWGLYDIHGNVAEWTLDLYWDRLPGGQIRDYYNNAQGRGRTIRGGSWESSAHLARSSSRTGLPQGSTRDSVGFRVVLAPELKY